METRNVNKNGPLGAITSPTNSGEADAASKAAKANQATPAAGAANARAPLGAGSKGVNVALSNQSKELADAHKKALDIARKTPDIREDRVADLKQRINAGTYEVDSAKIADGIMREAILDHLSEREE